MPSVQIIGSDTLSFALIEEARERLMAIGSHPLLCPSARHEPMRGSPEMLAVLMDASNYEAALLAAAKAERPYGRPFFVTRADEPWTISPDPVGEHPSRKGPKDSTHVPFWRNLPKRRR